MVNDTQLLSMEFDVRPADGGHANEVVGPCEKCGKGGGKRNLAAGGESGRGAQHVLFGDKILKKTVGKLLPEFVRVGGVLHIGVKGDLKGEHKTLSLDQLAEGGAGSLGFKFKHFHLFEGTLKLPEGFIPRQINVAVQSRIPVQSSSAASAPIRSGPGRSMPAAP